jgi:hypothetical protein
MHPARIGLVALVTALLTTPAAGAAVSSAHAVSGIELAATPTRGTFVGASFGSEGDRGVWKAVVDHTTPLRPASTITGGIFKMTTRTDAVAGAFAPGGAITLVAAEPGCGKERFTVRGPLAGVTTLSGASGTGFFDVVLTHFRTSLFGTCTTFGATVKGTVTFSLS